MKCWTPLFVLVACAGSKEPPVSADKEAPRPSSKGEECRLDAAAPREPKADAPLKIDVSHILVRHSELDEPQGATRSADEACLRALEALEELTSGEDWDAVVAKYSDAKSDSLGRVAHDELSPGFADAAFALDVDEISYVVESRRGFHVILRKQ